MHRYALSDAGWKRLEPLLPGRIGLPGRSGDENWLFLDAVLWMARTGAPWPDLLERFGKFNSVFQRFNRWSKKGVWARVHAELQDSDLGWIAIASTTIRAHQHGIVGDSSAGARKRGMRPTWPQPAKGLGAGSHRWRVAV